MWLPVLNLTDWANLAHQINLSEIFLYCTVGNLKRLHTRPQSRAGEPGTAGSSAPTTGAAETVRATWSSHSVPGSRWAKGPALQLQTRSSWRHPHARVPLAGAVAKGRTRFHPGARAKGGTATGDSVFRRPPPLTRTGRRAPVTPRRARSCSPRCEGRWAALAAPLGPAQ